MVGEAARSSCHPSLIPVFKSRPAGPGHWANVGSRSEAKISSVVTSLMITSGTPRPTKPSPHNKLTIDGSSPTRAYGDGITALPIPYPGRGGSRVPNPTNARAARSGPDDANAEGFRPSGRPGSNLLERSYRIGSRHRSRSCSKGTLKLAEAPGQDHPCRWPAHPLVPLGCARGHRRSFPNVSKPRGGTDRSSGRSGRETALGIALRPPGPSAQSQLGWGNRPRKEAKHAGPQLVTEPARRLKDQCRRDGGYPINAA